MSIVQTANIEVGKKSIENITIEWINEFNGFNFIEFKFQYYWTLVARRHLIHSTLD